MHGTNSLAPPIRALLRAYSNADPPVNRQRAITPRLLRTLFAACGGHDPTLRDTLHTHTADLIIGAFFFAMRSCEYLSTDTPGRTKIVVCKHIIFRDCQRRYVSHSDPDLPRLALYVSVTFVDQKNGNKMDTRTQRATGLDWLCPVKRWAAVVQRIQRWFPSATTDDFEVCSVPDPRSPEGSLLPNNFVRQLLRDTCRTYGGLHTFGFHPKHIGNKSIRSGAAMSLFMMGHSSAKIMILGRWSSDAFLVYIRPQIMEWTHSMSIDMTRTDTFTDVSTNHDLAGHDDPRQRDRSFNGPLSASASFYLYH